MNRMSICSLLSIPLFLGLSLPIYAQETPSPPTNDVQKSPYHSVKNPELLEYVQAPYPEVCKRKKDAKERYFS